MSWKIKEMDDSELKDQNNQTTFLQIMNMVFI